MAFRNLLAALLFFAIGAASAGDSSGFGNIAIPDPARPASADQCVEPVEIMRRDHMKFLDHQRDETVINGDRGSRHSLVGCMNCHNPADSAEVVRYEDPEHFCAECHRYASVKIDCFECHADRGLSQTTESRLAWEHEASGITASTLRQRTEKSDGE